MMSRLGAPAYDESSGRSATWAHLGTPVGRPSRCEQFKRQDADDAMIII